MAGLTYLAICGLVLAVGVAFALGARYGHRIGAARERKLLTAWYAEIERIREFKQRTGDTRQFVVQVDANGIATSTPIENGEQPC